MPPKRRTTTEQPVEEANTRSLRKRGRRELESIPEADVQRTPSKRRRSSPAQPKLDEIETKPESQEQIKEDGESPALAAANVPEPQDEGETPKATPRRRGRPPKASNGETPTPKTSRTADYETPVKLTDINGLTPKRGLAADRSARRKSTKALIEHVVGDEVSDEEVEDNLAREIYASSGEDDEEDLEGGDEGGDAAAAIDVATTPSKTPGRRGRPKRAKSPTPPRDLPPHELYFLHTKPGRPKTSNNTLASLSLLTHDEYFTILNDHKDRHDGDIEYLESLHAESFPQWTFELAQGFSLCMYGFGSKRRLLHNLAKHLHSKSRTTKGDKIVIVNGYAPNTTLREILSSIAAAVDPVHRIPVSQPSAMVQAIASQLSASDMTLSLIVNSIDAAPLRRPGTHAILAQLAAHPQVHLVCSADTPDFSLLWDVGVRSAFNFLFHDCTTFAPFSVEMDVVDEVHELLGRSARRINGREGVAFVLRSLPENAKNLFRLIVGEVLIAMEEEGTGAGEEGTGVEYRMLYNKAVEEFICSSEMAFRTLLKEFHDHQMIASRKDALGTELLSVPFRKDELEAILEDLMS